MTDFDADNFIRPGHGISDPNAPAWMKGILGGLLVALILSAVVYYDTTPPSPLAPIVYETQPLLPLIPMPPPEKQ
jgi:hypothetical protein